jgi:anti-anti-sigma factor
VSTFLHLDVTKDGADFSVRFRDHSIAFGVPTVVGEELCSVAGQEECRNIILDFSGVDLLTSEMLGKLVTLNKRMRRKGGKLTLCNICPYVREVFAITHLDTTFEIKETEVGG